ncbi:MAG TPA: PilZ domain-containing protein [Nitrospira sp.]|nr:PilZ domain-containing protein [Nitrospira sp.]
MTASEQPGASARDRREYYRITVTLPIRIQRELDETEAPFVEKPVNLSGGGLGVTIAEAYQVNDILAVALRLPEHSLFTAFAEVVRIEPIPYPGTTYRLHARFVRMAVKDREILISHITRLQRDHLQNHYSA